jgi:hypothetical protein
MRWLGRSPSTWSKLHFVGRNLEHAAALELKQQMEGVRGNPLISLTVGTLAWFDLGTSRQGPIIGFHGSFVPLSESEQPQPTEHDRATGVIVVQVSPRILHRMRRPLHDEAVVWPKLQPYEVCPVMQIPVASKRNNLNSMVWATKLEVHKSHSAPAAA